MPARWVGVVVAATAISCVLSHSGVPKLLLVSLDAFRYDYLDRKYMSNFQRFYSQGVRARWLGSAYITKTLLNHYGAVTGLYPEYHGITGNVVYDGATEEFWNSRTCVHGMACDKWFRGEPIWITNHNQQDLPGSSPRKTGAMYWIGSSSYIRNYTADYSKPFPQNYSAINFAESLDTVLTWFTDPVRPINLGLIYHPEPDATGHDHGTNSTEIGAVLRQIDVDFGAFLDRIDSHPQLSKELNIVIISDHGMADITGSINLSACIPDVREYLMVDNNPIYGLWYKSNGTNQQSYDVLAAKIRASLATDPQCSLVRVYTNTTMPFHYLSSLSSRIAPIVLEPPPGYVFGKQSSPANRKGGHGWNSSWDKMRGIFVARGPAFKKSYVSDGFDNVHLYEIMCHVLGLTPAANNGSWEAVSHLFAVVEGTRITAQTKLVIGLTVSGALLIGIVFALFGCRHFTIGNSAIFRGSGRVQEFFDMGDEEALLVYEPDDRRALRDGASLNAE